MKETIVVNFSGGRTSGFMCDWMLKNLNHLYDFIFVYANTGLEKEETLEFVDKCDKYFNLNLVWVEAVVARKKGDGTTHKIVDFNTASRDGEPMEEVIKKYGLPNMNWIHCTRETKIQPIESYIKNELKIEDYRLSLGIRFDEFNRVKNRKDVIFPLATIGKFSKEEILDFWKKMPFDLELDGEHLGNCKGCYKKSDKKLKMIADESPSDFDFWIDMENKYSNVLTEKETEKRIIYRNYRTAYEVKNNINLSENLSEQEDCAEECGSVISDYIPVVAQNVLFI